MPMAAKISRMVTYLERLVSMKLHNHIITWFCEITWQSKIIIYPLPQSLLLDFQHVFLLKMKILKTF